MPAPGKERVVAELCPRVYLIYGSQAAEDRERMWPGPAGAVAGLEQPLGAGFTFATSLASKSNVI